MNELEQDFSRPWEQSDVILLVEEQQFHAHRLILSMSSPVFSRMFASDFKEKDAEEIPLPGKKADEIREMLLAIYPTSWKTVSNERNCYFLLALAQEYQMTKLTQKCEDYLLEAVKKKEGVHVLETLVVAQSYSLEKVLAECINKTQSLHLTELKRHKMYEKIEPLSQQKMIELQLHKVENENQRMKRLAAEALRHWESVVSSLGNHIHSANYASSKNVPQKQVLLVDPIEVHMSTIERDQEDRSICRVRWLEHITHLKISKRICRKLRRRNNYEYGICDSIETETSRRFFCLHASLYGGSRTGILAIR